MSASIVAQRKLVAGKLRAYAEMWRDGGTPDIIHTTLALYSSFGVVDMPITKAFDVIANYLDPDGDAMYEGDDLDWTLESLLSED